jgi:hypothetical protein
MGCRQGCRHTALSACPTSARSGSKCRRVFALGQTVGPVPAHPPIQWSYRRWSPPAATGGEHAQDVTGPQPDGAFVGQSSARDSSPSASSQFSPGHPVRRPIAPRAGHPALCDERHRAVLQHLQVPVDPLAPRRPTSTATPPADPIAQHPQREGAPQSAYSWCWSTVWTPLSSGLAVSRSERDWGRGNLRPRS